MTLARPPLPFVPEKTCNRCGVLKDISAYRARAFGDRTYYEPTCKVCEAEQTRERALRRRRDGIPEHGVTEQECKDCGWMLPLSEFSPNMTNRLGVCKACKACMCKRATEWREKNPDKALNARLRRVYGIALEQYDALLAEQQGGCAICGRTDAGEKVKNTKRLGREAHPRLFVDHDHVTGKVRGLLCSYCNKGIGNFQDDPDLLRFALKYLEER